VIEGRPAERLKGAAAEAAQLRRAAQADAGLHAQLETIRAWQGGRLAATHADLLAHARYSAAAHFFLEDLYAPKDITRRDEELSRVVPTLVRFLPDAALDTVADALELDALSERLDNHLAHAWAGRPGEAMTEQAYAQAYRQAGTRPERETQIVLMLKVGRSLDRLVRKPLIAGLLATMGPAARASGLGVIHDFLQRGFAAFKAMGGAEPFLRLISEREAALMARLFEGTSTGLLSPGAGTP
jgi:hypothetical protein